MDQMHSSALSLDGSDELDEYAFLYPTSFAQDRLWFLHQFDASSPVYNMPAAVRLRGRLDQRALQQSLEEVIGRQESLRTTFAFVEEQPVQLIAPTATLAWSLLDLSGLPEQERERATVRLAQDEAQQPFDLERGPLLRACLLRLGEQDHVLLLTLHHIVTDAWSMAILIRDVAACYAALREMREVAWPALAVQYADYAVWQREWLQGEELERHLRYWRTQLAGVPALLPLPTDHPRPAVQTHRGARLRTHLPTELVMGLQRISQQQGATLFMTLLTAFQTLLLRVTGLSDVPVGSPVAGRTRVEVEGLIGFFVNTLVLRGDLSGDPAFLELLARVRQMCLDAYAHQDLPFEKLVEELDPVRNLSHSPLFQVMFALQNIPRTTLHLAELDLELLEFEAATAKFDLTVALEETAAGVEGQWEYNTDLFEAATIARLAQRFEILLRGIVAQPEQRLSQLPILDEAERRQLLVDWNAVPAIFPDQRGVHEQFEEQVRRTPDALALVYEEQHLTYGELNRRANQVAHVLRERGVGPEVRVGLCVERSPELVIGLLGVWKAEGACVLLDPGYPSERLIYTLTDSRAQLVLTQQDFTERMSQVDVPAFSLDTLSPEIARQPATNGTGEIGAMNLAYIIYTSGSTGIPRGVQVPHRGVLNLAQCQQDALTIGTGNRVLQFAALGFDAFIFEAVMALLSGATFVLTSRERLLPGPDLVHLLEEQCITAVTLPPSALAALSARTGIEEASILTASGTGMSANETSRISELDLMPTVTTLLVAGEACPASLVTQWSAGRRFFNLYGPTEITIWATAARCIPDGASPPIGRPIANTQVYVLDARLEPVPAGVVGELAIGGVGVARGYLNRPDLTADRFVPDPFSTISGTRLYRTGDLARWRSDGQLEFLGRRDNQVKLRGFRIELEEIEAVLSQHLRVREAVVQMRKDHFDIPYLVAYILPGEPAPTRQELRDYLRARLPEYMLPTTIVLLDALPFTPNGKVDRHALPAPDREQMSEVEGGQAPQTLIEKALAEVWAEVLGISRVSRQANFFELGGHSLLATQLISRVRSRLRIDLPVRALFEAQTLASFAERAAELRPTEQIVLALPIPNVPRESGLPLSFAQERLWFLDQLEPGNTAYSIPLALRLKGELHPLVLQQSFNEIVRRHESLRTTFTSAQDQPVQTIRPVFTLNFPLIDLTGISEQEREEEVQRQAIAEARRPFDLARDPLLRVTLLCLGTEEYVLLLTMHHIISDGWSMGILLKEVAALYTAFLTGQKSSLAELPIQYADYAIWQRKWLQGEVLETQLAYWKRQLADRPGRLDLPTDYPRPAFPTFRGAYQTLMVPGALADQLKTLSQEEGGTLFMTLLGAFSILLARHSGQSDLLIGTPIAGRTRSEVEGLIGLFLNTLVLRVNVEGEPTFREVLKRVCEMTLEAYAHQDLPFEQLVEVLQPERDLSRNPLFEVMINFVNTPQTALAFSSVALSNLEVDEPEAKFPLTLYIEEQGSEILLRLVYQRDIFSKRRMEIFLRQFRYLLEQIVEAPEQPVGLYSLVEPESRSLLPDPEEILPEPQYEPVTSMLISWATRAPDSTAVCQSGRQWSYGELVERAEAIAQGLLAQGVKRGDVVAVSGLRSLGLIATLVGVFMSGATLLTIDHTLPVRRKQVMLQEAGAKYLVRMDDRRGVDLADRDLSSLVTMMVDPLSGHVIGEALRQDQRATPLPVLSPDDAAYLFFTSGTTGVPKGVLGCHKGLGHFLTWQRATFAIAPGDRCSQLLGIGFDGVLRDIFLPLVSGATLCLPSEDDDRLVPGQMISWLAQEQITMLHIVPALAQTWLSELPVGGALCALRWVFFTGEPLTGMLALHWRKAFGMQGEIVNLYGPTETTLIKCYNRLPADLQPGVQPVGRPLPETQVLVLGKDNRLCGIGEPGEIVIRTPFRTLGYVNAPEEQQLRFVKNPFRDDDRDVLYYTGDRGRYMPDGELEILGRIDDQIKLRGVRIEPREIEFALMQHPAVQHAVVLLHEERTEGAIDSEDQSEKRLVAYVVPALVQQPVPAEAELRRFLQTWLPSSMIPSAFIVLSTLPLTANGKLDRRALPAPERIVERLGQYLAPRTPGEELVASIWEEVLQRTQVSIQDNFFELGGHSLLATRVVARIRQVFSLDLPLRLLFENPTVAELASCLEALRADDSVESVPSKPLVPVGRTHSLPLSFAQQRLWVLEQLEPGNVSYNLPAVVRLRGRLDQRALHRSLEEVIRHQESLRTTFAFVEEQPVQLIAPIATLAWSLLDLSHLSVQERERESMQLIHQEGYQPFDLARGPLLRACLLRLDEQDHVLLLTLHHIIIDGWSMAILIREASSCYAALREGREIQLPALAVQYADYAVWQREWLQGEELERHLRYWRTQLAGAPALLPLPTDHSRPAVQTHQGAMLLTHLPAELVAGLKRVSQQQGATLFMTLLAAFQSLLLRVTGLSDVPVGSPVAGRTRVEVEGLIGFFVNTLVLRGDLSGDPAFLELLARVRQMCLDAYAHQDLPFEKLVEELDPVRNLSHSPLFQVMFALQNIPRATLHVAELDLEPLEFEAATAKFDLTVVLEETAAGVEGQWEYNTDLFEAATIARLAQRFEILLRGIVAQPEQRLSQLPILDEVERRQLLVDWNPVPAIFPDQRGVHELFEEQVRRTPDALALMYEEEHLTYGELNRRANQVAHVLREWGVGPEVRVGLCVERSQALVIGLLGIWKAGGAGVLLDPGYSFEHLSAIFEDAGVPILLTQQRFVRKMPGEGRHLLCLDTHWAAISRQPGEDIPCSTHHTACVMYTFSSDVPAGVVISHASIAGVLAAMQEHIQTSASDVWLLFHTVTSDSLLRVLCGALLFGGSVSIVPPRLDRAFAAVLRLLLSRGVTILDQSPETLYQIMQADETAAVESLLKLRLLLPYMQKLDSPHGKPWLSQRANSGPQVIGVYGTIETGLFLAPDVLTTDEEINASPGYRIGRPLSGQQVYLLDTYLQPVAIGVTGELYIGGAGLAEGYLKRPELTAERFIPHLFSQRPGARLYKTGDKARYLPNGEIEYLRPLDSSERLSMAASSRIWDEQARDHAEGGDDGAPRTPIEDLLARIWADVLRIERIGIHDNFFKLGGDSILSIQIISRANQAGLQLTPRELFQYQTIATLASVVKTHPEAVINAEQGLVIGSVFLTPIQRWFFEKHLPNPHHWNQAVLLEVPLTLRPDLLEKTLKHLLEHHDALRLRFVQTNDGWQQSIAGPDEQIPFLLVDLSALDENEQTSTINALGADLQASLNLTHGPLIRMALMRLKVNQAQRLLIVIHHLLIDGVSWRILLEDFQLVYQQLSQGHPVQLPFKTTSFQQWAASLILYSQSAELQREVAFWASLRERHIEPLPLDYPGGVNTETSARTVTVGLSKEETGLLLRDVAAAYHTEINDVLLTALARAFAGWTGCPTLLVTLEGHGREEIGEQINLSRTIGWFTSMFPVVIDLEGTSDPGSALKSVKEQLRRIPMRGIGYGVLKYLATDPAVEAALQQIPQPEVSFNYLGQMDWGLQEASQLKLAQGSIGPSRDSSGKRSHLISINGVVIDEQLRLDWTFGEGIHSQSTIENLATRFIEALQSLIAHCMSSETTGYTPSDFPHVRMNQQQLDKLMARFR